MREVKFFPTVKCLKCEVGTMGGNGLFPTSYMGKWSKISCDINVTSGNSQEWFNILRACNENACSWLDLNSIMNLCFYSFSSDNMWGCC